MMKWLKRFGVGRKRSDIKDASNANNAKFNEPDGALDLSDPEVIANFKKISHSIKKNQSACPLKSGGLLLLDVEDIKSVFSSQLFSNQPSRFSALAPKNKTKYTAASVAANIPPFLDAPEHVEVRRWLSRTFFDRLKEFEPDIHRIAQQQLAKAKRKHQYLLIEDLAREFVTQTMIEFVGIAEPKENIKNYTAALFRLFAPAKNAEVFQQTNEALQNARDGFLRALEGRRKDKIPCLLNIMDQTSVDFFGSERQKDLMIADNALLILADGIENVEAAIGQVMLQWFELDNTTETVSTDFVSDCIRKETPGQTIPRIATTDRVINGKKISAGTPVFLSLASANAQSETQQDFSFGVGRHSCIGERLALIMVTTFCNELIKAEPDIDTSCLVYEPMFGHKWPRGVNVTLT